MKFIGVLATLCSVSAIRRAHYPNSHNDFDTTVYEQDYSIGKKGLLEAKKELLEDIQAQENRVAPHFNWRKTGVHDEDQFTDDYKVAKGYDRATEAMTPEQKEKFGKLKDF